MNIKDICALLHRLDHSDNGRDIQTMQIPQIQYKHGNVEFVLVLTFVNGDVVNLPKLLIGFGDYSFKKMARWAMYDELTNDYKQHAWLTLMELLDYKIVDAVDNLNINEDEQLTEF